MHTTKRTYLKDFIVVAAMAAVFALSPIGAQFAEAFSSLSNYLTIKPVVASTGRTFTTTVGTDASSIDIYASETAGTRSFRVAVDDTVPLTNLTMGQGAGDGVDIGADSSGGYVIASAQLITGGGLGQGGFIYEYDPDAGTGKFLQIVNGALSSGQLTVASGSTRTITGCNVVSLTSGGAGIGGTGAGTRTFVIDDGSGSSTDNVFGFCETSGSLG